MRRTDSLTKLLVAAALAVLLVRGFIVPAMAGDEPEPTPNATVVWQGRKLQEVTSLAALPPALQSVLGVGNSGIGGIADRDGNFNSTDFVNLKLPLRRFAVAGVSVTSVSAGIAPVDKPASNTSGANHTDAAKSEKGKAAATTAGGDKAVSDKRVYDNDIALVALEHGGIAVMVEVTLYSYIQTKPIATHTWTLYSTPKTLRGLVDQIDSPSQKPPH